MKVERCYLSGNQQADKNHKEVGDVAWLNHTVVEKTTSGKWKVVGHLCLFHGINAMKAGLSMQEPRALDIFKKARRQKNLLARHLTEVKRVAILEPTISPPQRIETVETVEPPEPLGEPPI